jgi:hypothetical protein
LYHYIKNNDNEGFIPVELKKEVNKTDILMDKIKELENKIDKLENKIDKLQLTSLD